MTKYVKVTDDLNTLPIAARSYHKVTRDKALALINEKQAIYTMTFDKEEGLKVASRKSLPTEEDTAVFAKNKFTPIQLHDYFKMKKELEVIKNKIAVLEAAIFEDVDAIGDNITVADKDGVVYTYDKVTLSCSYPEALINYLGNDAGVQYKPAPVDISKELKVIVMSIVTKNYEKCTSVKDVVAKLLPNEDVDKVFPKLKKTHDANIRFLMNSCNCTAEDAEMITDKVEKARNYEAIQNRYTHSKFTGTIDEFIEQLPSFFTVDTNTVIGTKTV